MPDALAGLGGQAGLISLVLAALVAGLVRGFAGFGTAMVFMPVAGQVLSPVGALITLIVMDMIGPLPNIPGAWAASERRDLGRLWAGMALGLPVGLFALSRVSPEAFRWGVSGIALGLLVALMLGLRYRGRLGAPVTLGAGAMSGFLGGLCGLAGPPVIMVYMASTLPARVVRANLLLFLMGVDLVTLVGLAVAGRMHLAMVVPGLVLVLPYLAGNVVGGRLFRPQYERIYRRVAYGIIAASAVAGLPLFD